MARLRFLLPVLIFAASCSGAAPAPGAAPARLLEVVDGDTLRAEVSGEIEEVRLAGFNAPERDECHGGDATAALIALLAGADLRLEVVPEADRDRFGRLLRYGFAGDTPLDLAMVVQGHAVAMAGDDPRADALSSAADTAWEDRIGLWAPEACGARIAAAVEITGILPDPPGDDAERPNAEYVTLRNAAEATLDAGGWILRDESSTNRYVFPAGTLLPPGVVVTLHSGCGADTGTDLYWCAGPVWSNTGDTVILMQPNGNVQDRLVYRPG